MIGIKLNPFVASFLKAKPDLVMEMESIDIEQFATPRSWTYLSKEINYIFLAKEEKFFFDNVFMIASQKVSLKASREFAKHTTYIKSLDIEQIVRQRKLFDAKKLKVLDQIIYAFLVNYIDTVDDAKYLVKLIRKNISVENFVGSLLIEAYNRYDSLLLDGRLKKAKGIEAFINNILGDASVDIGVDEVSKNSLFEIIEKYFNTK